MGQAPSYVLWLGSLRRQAKAVFSVVWGYELIYLSGSSGRSSSNPAKLFVVFTQANSHPTSLTKQGHWLCSAKYKLHLPTSGLKCLWTAQLLGIISTPSGQLGPKISSIVILKEFLCTLQSLGSPEITATFLLMDNHSDLAYKALSDQHENYLVNPVLKFFHAMNLRP